MTDIRFGWRAFGLLVALSLMAPTVMAQDDDEPPNELIDRAELRPDFTDLFDIAAPPDAAALGYWSPAARWPICPIHAALLPNGDVLTYGTDEESGNGLGFVYDRWNPDGGLAPESHGVLDVQTNNNIFCSAQTLLPGTGGLLLVTGGSVEVNGRRNFGTRQVNIYDPTDNQFFKQFNSMRYARWYPTITQLADGRVLVQGGRNDRRRPTTTPEIFDPSTGDWTSLSGATSSIYEGTGWNYPRSFFCPNGEVLTMPPGQTGVYYVSIRNAGRVRKVRDMSFEVASNNHMAVMYENSRILSIRDRDARILTLEGSSTVRSENVTDIATRRFWGDATLLPNGEVLVTGGSALNQSAENAVNYVEIWNPDAKQWRRGAVGQKSRLYHSTSLLLPNGTVLVGGGGPPGPVANLNAEIYYPPYLFTSTGDLRERPRILGGSGAGSVIRIRARGDEGTERLAFRIDGKIMKTVNLSTSFRSYFYTSDRQLTGDQVQLEFLNDVYLPDQGIDANARIDFMEIDGLRHDSDDPRTYVEQRSRRGALETTILTQSGYFEYFDQSTGPTDLGHVRYGRTLTCDVDRHGEIETARLIRFGSVTHSFDMGQRGLSLSFTQTDDTVSVAFPSTRKLVPPGHYMLFLVNTDGTPSEGAIVEVF